MNYFQYYSFDKLKSPQGGTVNDDLDAAIFIDINVFMYVTKYKILGGNLALVAGLPFANTGKSGAGYWGNALTFGDTFYLTKNKAISFSSYQLLEFHTENKDTGITPGTAFNLDYSLMMFYPLQKEEKALLQFGLVGYGQWQISDDGRAQRASDPQEHPLQSERDWIRVERDSTSEGSQHRNEVF